MQRALALYQSTVGRKAIVAATGLVLFGFVIQHMVGNLQIFLGPEVFNAYAAGIKAHPSLVWSVRTLLFVSLIAHIVFSISLASRNSDARPQDYAKRDDQVTSYAARTMVWSGPLLAVFITYHILHLTVGYSPTGHFSHTDVYTNFITGFRIWWVTAFYVFSQCLLGMHLFHGAWSLTQTFGLDHPRYNKLRRQISTGLAALVFAGNVAMPIAVYFHLVGPDDASAETPAIVVDAGTQDAPSPDQH